RFPDVPIIGFPRGAGGMLGAYARETKVSAVGLDTQVPLGWALGEVDAGLPVQGNLDPIALVTGGRALARGVDSILDSTAGKPWIFNLGHGVLQTTPPEHVAELVQRVRAR